MEIDHVLIAVADLATAAREIEARYGLAAIDGGRHPGWGTANRIVPLGNTYLELVAVVDEAEAAQSRFGRWVAAARPSLARPLGWAVRTHRLGDVARRLDLTVSTGSRVNQSGQPLHWRLAGLEQAAAEPALPFFIEWEPGTPHPGSDQANHPAGPVHIARLELSGDPDRLEQWLDAQCPRITIHAGAPAIADIVLTRTQGEIVLNDGFR